MTPFNQYAAYYDDLYVGKGYVHESELIESVFKRFSPFPVTSILSLGCGTATYEILLAKKGYKLTGLDFSEPMLKIGKTKIAAAKVAASVKLVRSDIREFSLPQATFDGAMMMFNIVGYLPTAKDLTHVAQNVARHLKPGGIFLFDGWYDQAVLVDPPQDRSKTITKNGTVITRHTYGSLDQAAKLVRIKFELLETKNGVTHKTVTEEHPMRYWSIPELESALAAGGLKLLQTTAFDNLDAPISKSDWNMQIICQKL